MLQCRESRLERIRDFFGKRRELARSSGDGKWEEWLVTKERQDSGPAFLSATGRCVTGLCTGIGGSDSKRHFSSVNNSSLGRCQDKQNVSTSGGSLCAVSLRVPTYSMSISLPISTRLASSLVLRPPCPPAASGGCTQRLAQQQPLDYANDSQVFTRERAETTAP